MSANRTAKSIVKALLGAVGAGSLAYAGLYEVNAFRLRRVTVPVLPRGARPIRVLHVSDVHMTPYARARQRWLSTLGALEPDLVINTGDNLAHEDAVPYVLGSFGRLLDRPGDIRLGRERLLRAEVQESAAVLEGPSRSDRLPEPTLPWHDLGRGFKEAGWIDLTHTRFVGDQGVRLGFRGPTTLTSTKIVMPEVAGPIDHDEIDVAIGVTHAPYRRVIDAMTYDGHDLIIAGTRTAARYAFRSTAPGDQRLDTRRAKGLSKHSAAGGRTAWLHVSAGVGTSPYAPIASPVLLRRPAHLDEH